MSSSNEPGICEEERKARIWQNYTAKFIPGDLPAPAQDLKREFKWRGDPQVTLSDWTLEIVTTKVAEDDDTLDVAEGEGEQEASATEPETVVKTYHVHRADLAYGVRMSKYFTTLFAGDFDEGNSSTSRVELEPEVAAVVPEMLDFLYSSDRPPKVTMGTAMALYQVGDYFEIDHLCWHVKKYLGDTLDVHDIAQVYPSAKALQAEDILGIIQRYLAVEMQYYTEGGGIEEVVEAVDVDFWKEVFVLKRDPNLAMEDCESRKVSDLASDIWKKGGFELETFFALTDERTVTFLSVESALYFAQYLEDPQNRSMLSREKYRCDSLRARCIAALAYKPDAMTIVAHQRTFNQTISRDKLKKLSHDFLIDLYWASSEKQPGGYTIPPIFVDSEGNKIYPDVNGVFPDIDELD